jgi:glycosyltransferase involved in cell wall biosynthesis
MSTPVLSVVVLAWDKADLTRRCLASIRAHTDVPYELIVVDNGSAAEGVAVATEGADRAVLNDTNLGFAAGMNQGLAEATGEFVAFVNNDTEVPAGWAGRLVGTFSDLPDAGLVLPAVTAAGNPYSVRDDVGDERIVVPRFREIPSGVLYVLPRPLAVAIGGWNEDYPVASSEDLDLLFTIWCTGREVVLDTRVLVAHVGSATVSEKLPDRDRIWKANRHAFTARWMAMTPENVPGGDGGDPGLVARRVEEAAIAATWMERAFLAREHAGAVLRRERAATATTPPSSPGMTTRLLRRLRSTYRRVAGGRPPPP